MKVTTDQVRSAHKGFASRLQDVGARLAAAGVVPTGDSPAAIEQAFRGEHDAVRVVHSQSSMLLESLFDHVGALDRTLSEPVLTVAPFSCLRGALEASSLACWLLEEGLDSRERLRRSFSLRRQGLEEQRKVARDLSRPFDAIDRRHNQLQAQITSLGLAEGAGAQLPPDITGLSKRLFGATYHYRFLSAILHAQTWAIIQLSFHRVSTDLAARESIYSKSLTNEVVLYMLALSAELIAKPTWWWTVYCGLCRPEVIQSLDAMYNSLGLKGLSRPWSGGEAG